MSNLIFVALNSLTSSACFKFTILDQGYEFLGLHFAAPSDTIFLPGFMCQLFVEVLSELNVRASGEGDRIKLILLPQDLSRGYSNSSSKWNCVSLSRSFQWRNDCNGGR